MASILEFFPLERRRPSQDKALLFIERAVEDGFRDIVVQAPTGSGKSAILQTVCNWAKSLPQLEGQPGGYYLTAQKLLQKQLEDDQPRMLPGLNSLKSIKSSVEYPCPHFKNCGFGARSKKKCPCGPTECAYKIAKGKFLASTIAVTNYAYFFAERRYAGKLEKRQLLALDECHNVERQIIRFVDLKISENELEKYAPTLDSVPRFIRSLEELLKWTKDVYLPEASARLDALILLAEDASDERISRDVFDLDQHLCKTRRALDDAKENPDQWIFWVEEDSDGKPEFIARPLHAAPFRKEMVDDGASLRIYTSAYPGDKEIFCRSLGLDPVETPMCKLTSDFDPEHRRVIVFGVGPMGKKNQAHTMPLVLKAVSKIVNKHKDERGIIHGHSYDICNQIYDHLSDTEHADRLVYPKKADEREEAFNRHLEMEGSILITPSMTEGFDFKDDLARWQIIPKVPWPSLGDKQVAAKAEMDGEWYSCETIKAFIQTCGRICRSVSDYGTTYVLDDDFWYLHRKAGYMFPKWFLKSISNARKK